MSDKKPIEQKVIITISDKKGANLSIEFEPALAGDKDWKKMGKQEKLFQHVAQKVAKAIVDEVA